MPTIVLLRHGESDWNRENRFTGWTDVDLSVTGIAEAHEAARLLAAEGLTFDVAYTSQLKRAIRTLWLVLDDLDLMWLPVRNSWRLNEATSKGSRLTRGRHDRHTGTNCERPHRPAGPR